jgi:hypothetical protein
MVLLLNESVITLHNPAPYLVFLLDEPRDVLCAPVLVLPVEGSVLGMPACLWAHKRYSVKLMLSSSSEVQWLR